MASYRIEIKLSAQKELAQLPKQIAPKIAGQILALAENCKKLVGTEHSYRIRVNDYRVVYSIFDQQLLIQVIKLAHRKDVYKQ